MKAWEGPVAGPDSPDLALSAEGESNRDQSHAKVWSEKGNPPCSNLRNDRSVWATMRDRWLAEPVESREHATEVTR